MKNNTNSLPDFLIIGAGKSGTTSLDNYLKQHPQIYINDHKEPNFFGYELYTESDFQRDRDMYDTPFEHYVLEMSDYQNLFKTAEPTQLKGETSNSYLYLKDAPQQIKNHIPDVKLIAILRQPAERLYSRFMHLCREDKAPTENFEDCLDKDSIWWVRNDLIKEGMYYSNIKRYFEMFKPENIKVVLYDDLRNDQGGLISDIFTYLGVDPDFEPNTSVEFNKSGYIKNPTVNKIVGSGGVLVKVGKSILPKKLYHKIKSSNVVQKKVNQVRNENLVRPKLSPEFKKKLTHEVYGEDIENLQQLLNRDLGHWL